MKKVIICIMALLLAFSAIACTAAPAPATQETATEAPAQTEAPAAAPREAELNIMMSFPQYMDQWET